MSQEISATEAARNFSEILNRVRYRGETFDIVRGGEVVATLGTAARRRATASALIAALDAVGDLEDLEFASDLEQIQREQPTLPDDPWAS